ncbi:MAG: hypothetical protein EOO29_28150, partial [Comamonadaceae bacterium]
MASSEKPCWPASSAPSETVSITLPTGATSVKVQVTNAAGTVIDTVSLGALDAGQHGFSLDAKGY